jgi:hypothetical protein
MGWAPSVGCSSVRGSPHSDTSWTADPGPGAVVTFDDSAKSVVLTRYAKTPEEFVGAMLSWRSGIGGRSSERHSDSKEIGYASQM